MNEKMNVYQKLLKARELFHSSNIKKSGRNKFADYNYFELSDIIPAILNACNQVQAVIVTSFVGDHATMRFINCEEPSEFIEFESPIRDCQIKGANEIQNLGAVETYVRRYLYYMAFDIIESDGSEATMGKPEEPRRGRTVEKPEVQTNSPYLNRSEAEALVNTLKAEGLYENFNVGFQKMGITKFSQLKRSDVNTFKSYLAEAKAESDELEDVTF